MTLEETLRSKREDILKDERLSYPPALVQINAPLALIQTALASQLHFIEEVLGLPKTKLPTKRNG